MEFLDGTLIGLKYDKTDSGKGMIIIKIYWTDYGFEYLFNLYILLYIL